MDKPKPVKYYVEKMDHTVVLDDPKQLVVEQGHHCIDGGRVTHQGKTGRLMVCYDNKPGLAAEVATWKSAWEQWTAYKAAEFERNVPGLEALETAQGAAYNEQCRYDAEFARMMATGDGIGPEPVDKTLAAKASELARQYPRAAMYLRAQAFTYASNIDKYSAGKEAMELIAAGGSLEDAQEILKNWLPASATWL